MSWQLSLVTSDVDEAEVVSEIVRYAREAEATFSIRAGQKVLDIDGPDSGTVVTYLTTKFPALQVTEV